MREYGVLIMGTHQVVLKGYPMSDIEHYIRVNPTSIIVYRTNNKTKRWKPVDKAEWRGNHPYIQEAE